MFKKIKCGICREVIEPYSKGMYTLRKDVYIIPREIITTKWRELHPYMCKQCYIIHELTK